MSLSKKENVMPEQSLIEQASELIREQYARYKRRDGKTALLKTAALLEISTYEVIDVGIYKRRNVYDSDYAARVLDAYRRNKNADVMIPENQDAKPKLWDKLPEKT